MAKETFTTEEQMLEKWCPWVRVSDTRSGSKPVVNRAGPEVLKHCLCIGSACSQWRWVPLYIDAEFRLAVARHAKATKDTSNRSVKSVDYVDTHREEFGLPTEAKYGYCGVAGIPER